MSKIYKMLFLFFWRLYAKRVPIPRGTGIPYQRDPDAPCEFYEPLKRPYWYFRDCETDGHYLCRKCIHNVNNNTNEHK